MAFPCEMKSAHSWAVRSSNPILRTFNVLEGRLASFCRPDRAANLVDSAFRASSPRRNFGLRYLVEANYRERCREGKTTSTAFVEPAVNQVVSKPFMKKQQMRWTEAGAHLRLQIRVQVLNGDWPATLSRWYPSMQLMPEPKAA